MDSKSNETKKNFIHFSFGSDLADLSIEQANRENIIALHIHTSSNRRCLSSSDEFIILLSTSNNYTKLRDRIFLEKYI